MSERLLTASDRVPAARPGNVRRPQLRALTGLRFVAALLVVLYHRRDLVSYVSGVDRIVDVGFTGVGLFFVLSGFVLAYNYANVPGPSTRAYIIARLARIYPVYLLGLVVALPIFLNAVAQRGAVLQDGIGGALVLFMMQAWFPDAAMLWNSPAWSLSVEAFFYALFPLLLPRMAAARDRPLIILVLVAAVASLVPPVWAAAVAEGAVSDRTLGILYHTPAFRLPEFVIGAALGVLFLRRSARSHSAVAAAHMTTAAAAVVVAVLIAGPSLSGELLRTGLFALPFGALVYTLSFGRGAIAWFLATPALVLLGEASYAIYILHEPLWIWIRFFFPGFVAAHPLAAVLAYLMVVMAGSIAAFRFLEVPARRWVRDRFGSAPARVASGA